MIAETSAHARALAQNLARQGFEVDAETVHEWVLRRRRRRGDITVTILIRQPDQPPQPPGAPSPWGPPSGPRAG